ncbi:amidohydrolase [Paraburkholderia sp. EG286B]|uniref:amidohydrolase n=1 Tax=Paraburkholderia sp. EG286B TaxID=3237011 RepID=UPI0034D3635B
METQTYIHDANEIAFVGASIYTGRNGAWAEAVLVRDGKIAAVGTDPQIRAQAAPHCRFEHLGGHMVMPGIHDAHTHLLLSGLKHKFDPRLPEGADTAALTQALLACGCCQTENGWLVGGEVNLNSLVATGFDKSALDAAFPDTPVYLYDYTIHHGVANSKALELAGVTSDTIDPPNGKYIRRHGSSEPNGVLVEMANTRVLRAMPARSRQMYKKALRWSTEVANQFGITSIQEASASRHFLEAARELDLDGELSLHVAAHLVWRDERFGEASAADLDELIRNRRQYATPHVRPDFIKIWLDGVPLPPYMTHSGLGEDGRVDTDNLIFSEDELFDALREFDAQGMTVKIHCAAEGAARVTLNAIERVRASNGPGRFHEIAHAGFVHPDDVKRLPGLGVTAEMSPAIWHRKEPEFAPLDAGFKFATLRDCGTTISVGSDWVLPPDPNLFPALQGMLERGKESVDLEYALSCMTLAGSRSVGLSHLIGTIEAGKSADFIALDRNLFTVPVSSIGETQVLKTIFEGRIVFDRISG